MFQILPHNQGVAKTIQPKPDGHMPSVRLSVPKQNLHNVTSGMDRATAGPFLIEEHLRSLLDPKCLTNIHT